jgi:hypothetical protein
MMSARPSALCACSMKFLRVVVVSQVGRDRNDLAAGGFGDFACGGFEHILSPRADRDVDAFLGKRQRDALADALAAAGDERGLALQLQVHVIFS